MELLTAEDDGGVGSGGVMVTLDFSVPVCILGILSAPRDADAQLSELLQQSGQTNYAPQQLHVILSCIVHRNILIITYRSIVSHHMTLCTALCAISGTPVNLSAYVVALV